MTFLKSTLSRRGFTSLAGAALFAAMMPAASMAQDVTIRSSSRTPPRSTGRSFWPAPVRRARISASTCRNSAPSRKPTSTARSAFSKTPSPAARPPSSSRRPNSRHSASRSTKPPSPFPVIGIDSAADSKAFTSFLTTDNNQGGRIAADGLAAAIRKRPARKRAKSPSSRACRASARSISAAPASWSRSRPNIRA